MSFFAICTPRRNVERFTKQIFFSRWLESFYNTEHHMNNFFCICRLYTFQLNRFHTQVVKEAYTAAQQNGNNVKRELIEPSSFEALPSNIRAVQSHNLIPGHSLSLSDSALNPVSNKGSLKIPCCLGDMMCHNKDRHMKRMLAIPAMRVIIGSPTAHNRSDGLSRLCADLCIHILGRSGGTRVSKIPVKQSQSALPHR